LCLSSSDPSPAPVEPPRTITRIQHFPTINMKLSCVSLFLGLALAQNDGGSSNDASLTDVLDANNSTLSVLSGLLSSNPTILEAVSNASNITILAPDNDALNAFLNNSQVQDMVMMDPGLVQAVLQYHVLNGTYYADNITDTPSFVPTLLDNSTYTNVTGGQVVEVVSNDGDVNIYSAAREMSSVTQADIAFSGGVIHVIDSVLSIPQNLTSTASSANLTAVAGAVTEADLGSSLDMMENITVFAPSNDAFAAIGSLIGELSTEDLGNILGYHVVAGTVGYSSSLMNGTLTTANGEDVDISIIGGDVFVDSARVIMPDVLIANGVVHVIDRVLNPDATGDATTPNPSTTSPAFSGASTASDGGVPLTSGVMGPTESATGTSPESTQAAPQVSAAVAMGALFGGAAAWMNGAI